MKQGGFNIVNTSTEKHKEVIWVAKDVEIRKIVSNLSKLGIQAKITKSRVELLKALALPQTPQIQ